MPIPPTRHHTPICPKCGYDQSGTIATWTDRCPLQGTCPECGYQLSWPDVANPSRIHLPWFVEHAKSKRQLLTRTLPTVWMLLFPNRYFRHVIMETPRSIKRYLLSLALLMLILHVITSAGFIMTVNVYATMMNGNSSAFEYSWPLIAESILFPIISNSFYYYGLSLIFGAALVVAIGISAMWFLLFIAFPATRKRSKLRVIHIARAMIVCVTLPLLLIELARMYDILLFIGVLWPSVSWLGSKSELIWTIGAASLILWIQWFWISATRIGWQIEAKWWELILVAIASIVGTIFAGLIILPFSSVRTAIDHLATYLGI